MLRGPTSALRAPWWAILFGLALVGIVSTSVGTARANEAPRPIRIDYAAPASCPDRAALIAHVRTRTANVRLVDDEAGRQVTVRVEQNDTGRFHGRLLFVATGGGAQQQRDLEDARCEDLIEALGFFIALSIEAERSAPAPAPVPAPTPAPAPVPAPTPAKPVAKESDAGPTPPPSPPPSPQPAASVAASPAPPAAAEAPRPSADPRSRARAPGWHLGGGMGGEVVGGVASNMVFGARGALELSHDPGDGPSLAPSFSLSAVSTLTDLASDARGAIALRWLAFIGTICPVTLPLSSFVHVRPCSGLEVGNLRGEGVGVEGARRSYAAWVAIGVSGRVEVPLSSVLWLQLDVGTAAPFERPRFGYTSGTVAFEAPPVGARTGLTLAFRQ